MARLRVRIELNRRMAGVPLEKMASVVEETRKFFYLLSEDVADPSRIAASGSRRTSMPSRSTSPPNTLDQFPPNRRTRLAPPLPELLRCARPPSRSSPGSPIFWAKTSWLDSGSTNPIRRPSPPNGAAFPSAMPCASAKRSSCWLQAAGEQSSETQLPAVMNGSVAGRRLFKDRREREALAADPSKAVREMESNLSRRIGLLEGEVAEQTRKMQQISGNPEAR